MLNIEDVNEMTSVQIYTCSIGAKDLIQDASIICQSEDLFESIQLHYGMNKIFDANLGFIRWTLFESHKDGKNVNNLIFFFSIDKIQLKKNSPKI